MAKKEEQNKVSQQKLLVKQQQQQELLRRQKEQQLLLQQKKQQKEQQELLRRQKEQELLLQKQKEQQLLLQKQQEQQKLLLIKQQQEKEKEKQILQQKQNEAIINQQQLEKQKKMLLLKQQQQRQNQNQKISHPKDNLIGLMSLNQQIPRQQQQKKSNIKIPKKIIPKANISKHKKSEEDENGPKDTIKSNSKRTSNSNINNKYNLPQMQRQYSSGANQQRMVNINQMEYSPQSQQYINYNTVNGNNLSNTNYNINIPNLGNTEYIYQNNIQPRAYIISGTNNQIIQNDDNDNDNYNLFNTGSYA